MLKMCLSVKFTNLHSWWEMIGWLARVVVVEGREGGFITQSKLGSLWSVGGALCTDCPLQMWLQVHDCHFRGLWPEHFWWCLPAHVFQPTGLGRIWNPYTISPEKTHSSHASWWEDANEAKEHFLLHPSAVCPLLHSPRISRIISSQPDNWFCLQSGSLEMLLFCLLCPKCVKGAGVTTCMVHNSGVRMSEVNSLRKCFWDDNFVDCYQIFFYHLLKFSSQAYIYFFELTKLLRYFIPYKSVPGFKNSNR